MKKYARITNEKTKACSVGLGSDLDFYKSLGMTELDVEKAYDGSWYLVGFAPSEPEKTYTEKRVAEYPPITEQLDMMYWDKVNGTSVWRDTIATVKAKYPKE